MKIARRFTTAGTNIFDTIEWTKRTSRISNADGTTVFEMNDAEVPVGWSQLATDIMVSKYFRKAGVPVIEPQTTSRDRAGDEEVGGTKESIAEARGVSEPRTGPEKSVRQVVHRLAGCWRAWGEKHGYFESKEDAQAFYDELVHMMLHQMAAPNSPQWFNTGLNWAYGITGPAQGHWVNDPESGRTLLAEDAYTHPQPHACFIQSINDDLVGQGGIMDLWVREARLFKYGSGTGTNFSSLRGEGEKLSGGGSSSGLMSWLRIGDRAAGAIKSGGTTRRAAKMVCLDADHPDIEAFVNWKVREELKVAAMVEGMKHLPREQQTLAKELGLELNYDFNGEAYYTVSGQNSNNSVRLTDAFFKAVHDDGEWNLTARTSGKVTKTLKARALWSQICRAAWRCADPGLQYDSTINAWHTCPNSGRINASNPCSEYMFLDNTACNLASINLMKFFNAETLEFDVEAYEHAIEIWTIVLEISVLMAAFPSEEIARQSWRFRTLGLGFANLGAMLMQAGIPYDSDAARAICAALSAILTGRSYATSAKMARQLGAFAGFGENRDAMLRVIRNHRRAAYGVPRDSEAYESLPIKPVPIDHEVFATGQLNVTNADLLLERAMRAWDEALNWGEAWGYRNAQVTVIAPTGTIGLLMDCDTTGVEPDFALVKFKKLAGGGYFKIANDSLRPALGTLGYDAEQIDAIVTHVMGTLNLDVTMPHQAGESRSDQTFREFLLDKGFTNEHLVAVENSLPTVFELGFAFSAWSMPESVLRKMRIDPEAAKRDTAFNGLRVMGLSTKEIEQLNEQICGTQTIEGSPHLKEEHLAVFDCANRCGRIGKRFIATDGHIRMMAASQPFISGAISKTINLPSEAAVSDIAHAYELSWELGLKANALYRDGSKLSQPLSTKSDTQLLEDEQDEEAVQAALGELSTEVAGVASAISTSSISSAPASLVDSGTGDAATAATAPPAQEPMYIERIVERIVERPLRRRLPDTRRSLTHHFNVAGHEGYLTVGLYENGAPGELFITMSKEGSTIGGLMDSLGTAISVALQYGVPVESLVTKFAHQRFEPMGMTTNREVPFAKSLVDYIFRWMGMEFIPGYREANAPQRPSDKKSAAEATKKETLVTEDNTWSGRSEQHHTLASGASNHMDTSHAAGRIPTTNARLATGDMSGGETSLLPHPTFDGSVAVRTARSSQGAISIVQAASIAGMSCSEAGVVESEVMVMASHTLSQSTAAMQSDAPACDVCGAITVRNGTCYKCLNCGNSMGCG